MTTVAQTHSAVDQQGHQKLRVPPDEDAADVETFI